MAKDTPGPDTLVDPPPSEVSPGAAGEPDLADEAAQVAVRLAKEHLRDLANARAMTLELMERVNRRNAIDLESVEIERTHCQSQSQFTAPPPKPPRIEDPAGAFDKLTRSLRRTIALEMKLAQHLRDLAAGLPAEREARRAERSRQAAAAAEARRQAAKDKVRDLAMDAILAEDSDGKDSFELSDALDERLDEDDAYMDLETLPLRKVVESICKDLKVAADWSRWTGEGWKPRPFPSRPKWSEFNTPSRKPLMGPPPPPQVAIDEINAELALVRQKAAEARKHAAGSGGPGP